jgi:hypothetical protein
MLYLIINGPPRSGKTHVARELTALFTAAGLTVAQDSFAAPMKHFIAVALGEKYQQMQKDEPRQIFLGTSVRSFLIDLSENYMKVKYGIDIFGRLLVHRSNRLDPKPDILIVDDAGFDEEVEALGEGKYVLVKLSRPDHTFKGDSRSYINGFHYQINNGGTEHDLHKSCMELVLELVPMINAVKQGGKLQDGT